MSQQSEHQESSDVHRLSADELFVESAQDLQQRTRLNARSYDLLHVPILIRRLILDDRPVVHTVNRQRRFPLIFTVVPLRAAIPIRGLGTGCGGLRVAVLCPLCRNSRTHASQTGNCGSGWFARPARHHGRGQAVGWRAPGGIVIVLGHFARMRLITRVRSYHSRISGALKDPDEQSCPTPPPRRSRSAGQLRRRDGPQS